MHTLFFILYLCKSHLSRLAKGPLSWLGIEVKVKYCDRDTIELNNIKTKNGLGKSRDKLFLPLRIWVVSKIILLHFNKG